MSKARILIVEDSFIVAYHLQKTLETEEYLVVGTESSGEGALKFLEDKSADLVLMDIMLGGTLDGIETSNIIRKTYNLPVIYITALSDKETIQRAKVTEPFGYLTKPFEDREIFTVIEMALYKHQIETRLRVSEEKYFSTVKSISDCVFVLDNNFCVSYINPSVEALTGVSLSDASGKIFHEIFRFKDEAQDYEEVSPFQSLARGERTNVLPEPLYLVGKGGELIPVGEGSLSPILDNKSKFIGWIMILKDITAKLDHEKLVRDFERRRLSALIQGQEQERSRIAKDLHDGLGQMLSAIKMNVKLLGSDQGCVEKLYELIDEAIQESIRISENLLPSKLKNFDLPTCLDSLCSFISRTSNVPVAFESLDNRADLDENYKVNLYRIAQEAINNAIKHGSAKQITVQLSQSEELVQLIIEDDGHGFDKNQLLDQTKHHGLVNMKERAEILGGRLTVESDPERGTLIIVEAPISQNIE